MEALQTHVLYMNRKKCEFGVANVAYLGHVVLAEGITMDMDKVAAMFSWPLPKNLKQLRGFLSLTGYYHKIIKGYANIAKPLMEQLKNDTYGWNDDATVAFKALKSAMTTAPVLNLPNFSQKFLIETDASNHGLGVVLIPE